MRENFEKRHQWIVFRYFAPANQPLERICIVAIVVLLHTLFFAYSKYVVKKESHVPVHFMDVWNVPQPDTRMKALVLRSLSHNSTAHTAQMAHRVLLTVLPVEQLHQEESSVSGIEAASEGAKTESFASLPPPALDIEHLRALARDDERQRVKTPLEELHDKQRVSHSIETKIAEAAVHSIRKDCQTAYGSAGIFALVPLIYGTLTDDGCKWK